MLWRNEAELLRILNISNTCTLLSLFFKTEHCYPYTASNWSRWKCSTEAHWRTSLLQRWLATRTLKQVHSLKISFPLSSKRNQHVHPHRGESSYLTFHPNSKHHKHSWGKNPFSLTLTPTHLSPLQKKKCLFNSAAPQRSCRISSTH